MPDPSLSRRDFLVISGGASAGLVLSFALPARARLATTAPGDAELNAWIRIAPDGSVSFASSEIEMGQGVATSIPMILAEELEVPWESVSVHHAGVDERFGPMRTGGSQSIRKGFNDFRRAGAAAREMLIAAAMLEWNAPRDACRASDGIVTHVPSGRTLQYGQLAAKAATLTPPAEPPLKDRSQYKIVGRRVRRLDTPAKVDGSAIYGLDVKVEGMRVAQVERPPTLAGSVASFDASEALKVEGVERVVEIPSGVAVVARSTWPAAKGRKRLRVDWKPGRVDISDAKIMAEYRAEKGDGADPVPFKQSAL